MASNFVKFRAVDADRERWHLAAAAAGVTLSEWLRDLAETAAATGADVGQLRGEIVRLRADLNRGVGNNLNQIAAALNADLKADRAPDTPVYEQAIVAMVEDVAAIRKAIERALRLLVRRRAS